MSRSELQMIDMNMLSLIIKLITLGYHRPRRRDGLCVNISSLDANEMGPRAPRAMELNVCGDFTLQLVIQVQEAQGIWINPSNQDLPTCCLLELKD